MRSVLRVVAVLVVLLILGGLLMTVVNRVGNDPLHWLVVGISAAAAIVFYLQILKDW